MDQLSSLPSSYLKIHPLGAAGHGCGRGGCELYHGAVP